MVADLTHVVFAFGQVEIEAKFVFQRFVRQDNITFAALCDRIILAYLRYCVDAWPDGVQPVIKG
ncbi:MAG: hypothetical protein N4A61_08755 [Pelagimonas sp.]|nr:hypothetical protein [Pelagimonas sp.]